MRAGLAIAVALVCGSGCKKSPPPVRATVPAAFSFGASVHLFGALEGLTFSSKTADLMRVPGMKRIDNLPFDQTPEYLMSVGPPAPESESLKLDPPKLEIAAPPPPPVGAGHIEHVLETYSVFAGGILYTVDTRDDLVWKATFVVRGRSVGDLVRAWGPAAKRETGDESSIFFDTAHHVRATVPGFAGQDPVSIEVRSYVPLATILDRDPSKLFGVRVLGRLLSDVAADLKPHYTDRDRGLVTFDPTEYSTEDSILELREGDGGTVEGWSLPRPLYHPSDAMFAEVSTLYSRLWGSPREEGDYIAIYGSGTPEIQMDRRYASLTVRGTPPPN